MWRGGYRRVYRTLNRTGLGSEHSPGMPPGTATVPLAPEDGIWMLRVRANRPLSTTLIGVLVVFC